MNWHKRITQARTAKNLRKTELAKLVGVSPATVTMWESGQTKKIDGTNLIKVCDVLGISPVWLLNEQGRGDEAEKWEEYAKETNTYRMELLTAQISQFIPDDSPEGYRIEPEYELGLESLFALRQQWLQANRLLMNDLLVMRVKSLDMEPAIAYGDILVLDSVGCEIADGSIYVLIYEGAILVRRIIRDAGEWWLASDHPDQRRYARKLYRSEDVKMIGKVILRQTEKV